jgi:ABC transport system ATP-binding/permease protein
MMILTIENLTKSYGEKLLFENVSLYVDTGDKVGIVGVNGTGKTTFLRAVAGLTPVDSGNFAAMRSLRISYLAQDKVFEPENTVLMEVFCGDSPLMQALREYEILLQKGVAELSPKTYEQDLLRLTAGIDEFNGWQLESDAKTVLTRLGITDFTAKTATLSGGQQKRLALATALLQPCDLLLLDEPTNHLDSETISWLEEYLRGRRGALLMVTHDRYFLDHVAGKILELDKGHAFTYIGNYTSFLEQKTAREEREEAGEKKRQNFLRNELVWIRRGAQARSTKQRARIERYEEVKNQKADLERPQVEIGLAGSRLGRTVIELSHVGQTFAGQELIRDFSYVVLRHDRVGILGANGSGKTTLLDIIAGRRQPSCGTVKIGQTVKIGYFAQTNAEMDERLRAIEYIREVAEYITLADGTRLSASQLMERFLFSGELQWMPIGRLSGGEKRRLYLLRVLMGEPNVLLLDEPTNDLDLETMAILEDFIENFRGAIIFVSHDRFFIDRLATKVFVLQNDGHLRQYMGGYTDYRIQAEADMQAESACMKPKLKETQDEEVKERQSIRHVEAKRRFTFKEQKEYEAIEAVIQSTEGELRVTRQQMADCVSDYTRLNALAEDEVRLSAELERLMLRWTYLEEIAENQ